MSSGRPPTFFQISPPERGSFPLDHDGECTTAMREYLGCLKRNKNNNGACRQYSKAYLQCRMDHQLMDSDNLENLGFDSTPEEVAQDPKAQAQPEGQTRLL